MKCMNCGKETDKVFLCSDKCEREYTQWLKSTSKLKVDSAGALGSSCRTINPEIKTAYQIEQEGQK